MFSQIFFKPCSHRTFPLHAHCQALLVAAVLAAIALTFVNQALFVVPASVTQVFSHCTFEETFATLTAVHSIVLACKLYKYYRELEAGGNLKQDHVNTAS